MPTSSIKSSKCILEVNMLCGCSLTLNRYVSVVHASFCLISTTFNTKLSECKDSSLTMYCSLDLYLVYHSLVF